MKERSLESGNGLDAGGDTIVTHRAPVGRWVGRSVIPARNASPSSAALNPPLIRNRANGVPNGMIASP